MSFSRLWQVALIQTRAVAAAVFALRHSS